MKNLANQETGLDTLPVIMLKQDGKFICSSCISFKTTTNFVLMLRYASKSGSSNWIPARCSLTC